MEDREIIKALECCCKAKLNRDCKILKCPFFDYEIDNCTNEGDMDAMYRFALDLINRQQAEFEKLNIELQAMRGAANSYKAESEQWKEEANRYQNLWCEAENDIQTAKAEAYKECIEKVKEISEYETYCDNRLPAPIITYHITKDNLENIVKEMAGEG